MYSLAEFYIRCIFFILMIISYSYDLLTLHKRVF